ncbi:hypothetical protein ANN_18545 [Periplaneta americana]|uniref:Uncharacterized protein n=1 Tax=Periplaneta americana TaxID=6978 RepID=A0ABQ8SPI7_PERAM|nr:hypothetical protein ANN_18545 [Periplaneta americana]
MAGLCEGGNEPPGSLKTSNRMGQEGKEGRDRDGLMEWMVMRELLGIPIVEPTVRFEMDDQEANNVNDERIQRRWMAFATSTRGGPTLGRSFASDRQGGLGEVAEAEMVYGFLLAVGTSRQGVIGSRETSSELVESRELKKLEVPRERPALNERASSLLARRRESFKRRTCCKRKKASSLAKIPPGTRNVFVYELVLNGRQRTNNVVEGFHSQFQRLVVAHHFNIWRLIQHLQQQQADTETLVQNLVVPPLVTITAATLSGMLSTSLCRISTGMRRHSSCNMALSWTMEVGPMFRRLLCSAMQTIMFTGWTGLLRVLISILLNTFGMNWTAIEKKKHLLRTSEERTKEELVKCFVWSVALYGAETWRARGSEEKSLEEVFEMWVWSRMELVKWTDRIRNEAVLKIAREEIIMLKMNRREERNWLD